MANVALPNDETVCDYKLNKDESTDESNLVCSLSDLPDFSPSVTVPNSPDFFHSTTRSIIISILLFANSTTFDFTSKRPSALNQGAVSQSNPFPKVLSAFATYQWHEVSGTSTAHFDQSSSHCGT